MTRILLQGIDDRGKAGVFLGRDTEFRVSVTDQRGTVAPATGRNGVRGSGCPLVHERREGARSGRATASWD